MPYIQKVASGSGVVSPLVLTTTTVTTAGNTVFITATSGSAFIVSGVTDSRGNTYIVDKSTAASARTASIIRGFQTTALHIGDTITVTFTGSGANAADVHEFSNVRQTTPFDGNNAAQGSTTSVATGSTATLTKADELVITLAGAAVSGTWTVPGGYTEIGTHAASSLDAAYKYVTANTAVSASWTYTGTGNSGAVIATYIVNLSPSVNDTITTSEKVDITRASARDTSVSDTLGTVENTVVLISDCSLSVSDTIGTSEVVTSPLVDYKIVVNDSVSSTESTILTGVAFINDSDTVNTIESVATTYDDNEPVSDTVNTAENILVQIAALGALTVSVSDIANTSESILRMADENISKSDTTTLTDTPLGLIPTLFITINDTNSPTENVPTLALSYGIDVEPSAAYLINGVKIV